MKKAPKVAILLAAGAVLLAAQTGITRRISAPASHPVIITLQLTDYAQEMQKLRAQDLDIAGINFPDKQVDLVVDSEDISWLRDQGFKVLMRPYTELYADPYTKLYAEVMAPDQNYKNPQEIETILKSYAQAHPERAKVFSIGKSLEGRDIFAIKISYNVETREREEPTIFFNSMHHAREVMTPEVAIDIIDQLLTGYGQDARITHWVDSNEIYVIPMLNVDGNNKVWTGNSMWRKNTRDGHGVDINRNYPYRWGQCNGSSPYTWAQDYRGPSAASEPETQALMNFVADIRPVFSISYHSYSELVLYPFSRDGEFTPNHEVVDQIGKEMASLLPSDAGRGRTYTPGTPWEILYAVDGGDIDWMFNEHQVIPYVIELNSSRQGFQPSYAQWRDRTVVQQRAAWQMLLDRLEGPSVRGFVQNSRGEPLRNGALRIARLGSSAKPFNQNYRINPDGSYHIVLNPGVYQLTFMANGFESQVHEVRVEDSRVPLDIQLSTAR